LLLPILAPTLQALASYPSLPFSKDAKGVPFVITQSTLRLSLNEKAMTSIKTNLIIAVGLVSFAFLKTNFFMACEIGMS
jgi:hypothetical protein